MLREGGLRKGKSEEVTKRGRDISMGVRERGREEQYGQPFSHLILIY